MVNATAPGILIRNLKIEHDAADKAIPVLTPVSAGNASPAVPADRRLTVFVRETCAACDSLVSTLLTLDIYLVTAVVMICDFTTGVSRIISILHGLSGVTSRLTMMPGVGSTTVAGRCPPSSKSRGHMAGR
ncbi:hypothetical protein ACU62C_22705 [Klebsiella aerogenes]